MAGGSDSLIVVERLLPSTVTLHTNFDTSKYHLLAATEVDTQLDNISVVNWPWP